MQCIIYLSLLALGKDLRSRGKCGIDNTVFSHMEYVTNFTGYHGVTAGEPPVAPSSQERISLSALNVCLKTSNTPFQIG